MQLIKNLYRVCSLFFSVSSSFPCLTSLQLKFHDPKKKGKKKPKTKQSFNQTFIVHFFFSLTWPAMLLFIYSIQVSLVSVILDFHNFSRLAPDTLCMKVRCALMSGAFFSSNFFVIQHPILPNNCNLHFTVRVDIGFPSWPRPANVLQKTG